jgi:hypothetical protein
MNLLTKGFYLKILIINGGKIISNDDYAIQKRKNFNEIFTLQSDGIIKEIKMSNVEDFGQMSHKPH